MEDKEFKVIDSHIHCGVQNVSLPFGPIRNALDKAGIDGCCLFAPVEDIYYRYARTFDDNHEWRSCRKQAHDYLLALAEENPLVFPYYFVWNDFKTEALDRPFKGIKWHHHAGEPEYHYNTPECRAMIEVICKKGLPVVLEETFETTLEFLEKIKGRTVVIIPHMGLLNGGFDRLFAAGVWESETVYADTALAGEKEISAFIERYGPDRVLFGSDYPFGDPQRELAGVLNLGLDKESLEKVLSKNIEGLVKVDFGL